MASKNKILFFIVSPSPSPAERLAAESLESKRAFVAFRNVSAIGENDSIERADGFAGCVPELYKTRFPDTPIHGEPKAPAPLAPVIVATPAPDDAQRIAEDEGAKQATAAQLKAALEQIGIKFASNASKAELLALFLNR